MAAVCLLFALGVAGVSSDARRVLGAGEESWAVPDADGVRVTAPQFAYEFAGAAENRLQRPVGICIADEQVFVADSLAGHVSVFRRDGVAQSVLGAGRLDVPVGMACDVGTAELLVTDRALGELLVFGFDGSFVETITPTIRSGSTTSSADVDGVAASSEATVGAWAPVAVTFAEDGTIHVTDVSDAGHRVWHLARTGEVLGITPALSAGREDELVFDFPNGVVASGGRVWVADSNNRRLVEIDALGGLVRSIPLGRLIRGLALMPRTEEAARPHFALIDAFSHEVVFVSDVGTEVGRVGGPGSGGGGLSFPNDVAVTASAVYVADTGNARIQVFEWSPSTGLRSLVWPGGPSWLGLFSSPLLLAPLALIGLARPVRVVASREALEHMSAVAHETWRWRRVRLVVTPAVAEDALWWGGPDVEVSDFSHPDASALEAQFELGPEHSATLTLALRHRVLLAGDPLLATVAAARGVEVLDVAGFVEEFALPSATEGDLGAYGDTEDNHG